MKKQVMLIVSIAFATCGARAAIIDFENGMLGVNVSDNMAVQDQYMTTAAGVSFRTGTGNNYGAFTGSAYIEQIGTQAGASETGAAIGNNSGFLWKNDANGIDANDTACQAITGRDGLTVTERQNALGSYFLRTRGFSQDKLTVTYNSKVTQASFEVWDIDGTATGGEGWTIKAYNGNWNNVVLTKETPFVFNDMTDMGSYDGQRFVVELSQVGVEFDRFVVEFGIAGQNNKPITEAVGLAFNNFNTTAVPEPTSMALLAIGCAALGLRRRGRNTQKA